MKKIYQLITATVIFLFTCCYWGYSEILKIKPNNNQIEINQKNSSGQTSGSDSISLNWKIYTNKRLGITFQYPNTWLKNAKDLEVINLSGSITSVELSFYDTIFNSTLLLKYHFAPQGTELYKYAVSKHDSAVVDQNETVSRQIEVAGCKAIETITAIYVDGKGNTINPSLRLIIVNFLDKQQTNEIEIQFKTPLPSDKEVAKFKLLLSTFKLVN